MTVPFVLLAVGPLVAVVGRVAAHLRPAAPTPASAECEGWALESGLEAPLLRFLFGFGLLSLVLFGLVYFGAFTTAGLCIAAAGSVGLALAMHPRTRAALAPSSIGRDLAAGLLLALLALGFGFFLPAYDLTLAGSDGSVYLAAAHQLAAEGRLQHHDPLVTEMNPDEQRLFFEQTSDGRLPGGIPLLDAATGRVGFSFYHLLPAWLALGLKANGNDGDLQVWSLFPLVSLCASFVIGRRLGGAALGLAFCLVQLCFLPQVFFARFPTSELLSQALFLSGVAFLVARPGRGPVQVQDATAAGVLWGAMCLARVDSIPFLCIGLALTGFLYRRVNVPANAWLVLAAWVVACSSLGLHHQLASSSYLFLPAMTPLSARLGLLLPGLFSEPWGRLVVAAIAAALVTGSYLAGRHAGHLRIFRVARALLALPAAAVLAHFAGQWHWPAVSRHIEWLTWYTTPAGLAILAAGFSFGALRWARSTSEPGRRFLLALLAGPALCYLINPMVSRMHPWAMRRFIPMVIPLFLLLSLLGWKDLSARLWSRRTRLRLLTEAGILTVVVAALLPQSARVAPRGTTFPVRDQLRQLAGALPDKALVLVFDRDAWLHLQTAVDFVLRRETLVLPLDVGRDSRKESLVTGYLNRQLARGRRLMLLLPGYDTDAGDLPRSYALSPRFAQMLDYVQVPYPSDRPPRPVSVERLLARVFELRPIARGPSWHTIQIGDPAQDIAVLLGGFYPARPHGAAEGGRLYRWTGSVARLALPPLSEAALVVDGWRPPDTPAARLEIDVDGKPVEEARFEHRGPQCLRLRLPTEPVDANRIVTLRASTFREGPGGRELGVRVFTVSIDGRCATHAHCRDPVGGATQGGASCLDAVRAEGEAFESAPQSTEAPR